jgi:hypothetical protein
LGTRAGSGRIGSLGRPAGLQLCRAAGRHRRCLRVGHRLPRRALLRSRLRYVRELVLSRRDSACRGSRGGRWDGSSRSGRRRSRGRRWVDAELAGFRRRPVAEFDRARCHGLGNRGRVGVGRGNAKPIQRCVLGRPRGGAPAGRCGVGRSSTRCVVGLANRRVVRSGTRCVVRSAPRRVVGAATRRVVRSATRCVVRSAARWLSRFASRCDRDFLLRRRRGVMPSIVSGETRTPHPVLRLLAGARAMPPTGSAL